METVLGLVGIVVWIVAVIALAAAVTWVVVRLTPGERPSGGDASPEA